MTHKIKVWYVLHGSMLCGESEVQLFSTEAKARAEYDKLLTALKKECHADALEDEDCFTENSVEGVTANAWVSGDAKNGCDDTDEYLELHYQLIEVSEAEEVLDGELGVCPTPEEIDEGAEAKADLHRKYGQD